jgi:hypothetical protein
VCNTEQLSRWLGSTVFAMTHEIQITNVKNDGGDGVIVTFSDGTASAYVVEELLELRPCRENLDKPVEAQSQPMTGSSL